MGQILHDGIHVPEAACRAMKNRRESLIPLTLRYGDDSGSAGKRAQRGSDKSPSAKAGARRPDRARFPKGTVSA